MTDLTKLLVQRVINCFSSFNTDNLRFSLKWGAIAIIDGYHREAVANFAGALEKFFEFYVHFVLLKFCTKPEVFQDMWKLLGNYSERQLGAFFLAYALDTGEDPPYVGRKPVEFRNRVVHKGYIPTREETIEYGAEIGRFIWPVLERVRNGHKIQRTFRAHLQN